MEKHKHARNEIKNNSFLCYFYLWEILRYVAGVLCCLVRVARTQCIQYRGKNVSYCLSLSFKYR